MDFRFSAEDQDFREEVATFADSELPWDWRDRSIDPEEPDEGILVGQFRKKLAGKGWLTMAWPRESTFLTAWSQHATVDMDCFLHPEVFCTSRTRALLQMRARSIQNATARPANRIAAPTFATSFAVRKRWAHASPRSTTFAST